MIDALIEINDQIVEVSIVDGRPVEVSVSGEQGPPGPDTADAISALRESFGALPIKLIGASGSGVENSIVLEAESAGQSFVDLGGLTITTTLDAADLAKNYFGGTLIALNALGVPEKVKNRAPFDDTEIGRPRTKSPILGWRGKRVLWLGTSIPAYGRTPDGNSYPDLFANALDATVINNAWASSHATYDRLGSSTDLYGTVAALSMTEDDRLAGLATYGGSSVYSDAYDTITKASEMTADFRIKAAFATADVDVVILDHGINDSHKSIGTLTPETRTITAIAKGSTTTVTLSNIGSIAVGDAVALRVTGISKLDYAAARVQSVAGNSFTINVNSSGFAGSFASGTAQKLDRNTVSGAFEFLLHYIQWAAILNGRVAPVVILASVPSNYAYNAFSDEYSSVSKAIYAVSQKWGAGFFDANYILDVKAGEQLVYFPDEVHPTTPETRQAIANHWVQWAQGGAPKAYSPGAFLPAVVGTENADQRQAFYSHLLGGFSTDPYSLSDAATVLADDFADGNYTGWTAGGTGAAPTIVTAPWSGAEKALFAHVTASGTSSIARAAVLDDFGSIEFDVYLPVTSGLVSSGATGLVTIARLANSLGNAVAEIQLFVEAARTSLIVSHYTLPNNSGLNYISRTVLDPATRYRVKVSHLIGAAGFGGAMMLELNGAVVARVTGIENTTQTAIQSVTLGVGYTTVSAIDVYLGNVTLAKRGALDFASRFTGANGGVTYVNGVATASAGGWIDYPVTIVPDAGAYGSPPAITYAKYKDLGDIVKIDAEWQIPSAGTGTGPIRVSWPVGLPPVGAFLGKAINLSAGTELRVIGNAGGLATIRLIDPTGGNAGVTGHYYKLEAEYRR